MDANGNPPYNRRGRFARGEAKGESGAALWGVLAVGRIGRRLPGWEAAVGASTSPLSVLGATGGRKSPREADGGMAAETNAGSQQGKGSGVFFFSSFPGGRSFPFKPACPCLWAPAEGLSWESNRAHWKGLGSHSALHLGKGLPRREEAQLTPCSSESRRRRLLSPTTTTLRPRIASEREAWRALGASFARGP